MSSNHWFLALFTLALAVVGCGGTEELAQDEDAVEGCQWNSIAHYTYEFGGAYYRADVSYNFSTGRTWFDQKRIGGQRLPQHSLAPYWPSCPGSNQTISLRASGHQHNCTMVCGAGGDRELHCDSSDLPSGAPVQLNLDYKGTTFECFL